ncbi:ComEC family competence protein [Candidatus Dojkabacteria bacterium]|nr:ComEC family competence protein [Candidatus Dojkabacteria bacterium]
MSKQKILTLTTSFVLSVMVIEVSMNSSILYILVLCLTIALIFLKRSIGFHIPLLIIVGLFLGGCRYEQFINNSYYKYTSLLGSEVDFEGYLIEEPSSVSVNKSKFVFKDDGIGRVLVYVKKYPAFRQGERLKLSGVLEEAPEFSDFSYKKYLQTESIFFVVNKVHSVESIGFKEGLIGRLSNYKMARIDFVNKYIQYPYSVLANGMIFGEKGDFSESLKNTLMINGVMHVTAVSGFNISILFNYLFYLSRFVNRKFVNMGSIFLLFFFILLVGVYNYSALRAVIFAGILNSGKIFGVKTNNLNLISITVFIMLFFNPFVYRSASFLFSLAAIISIFYLNTVIKKLFRIKEVLSSAISVSLLTGLLQIYMFKSFSLIGIVVNIIVAPLISLITLLGVLVVFISSFNESVAGFMTLYLALMLRGLIFILSIGSMMGHLYFENIKINFVVLILVGTVMFLLMWKVYFSRIDHKLSKFPVK